MPSSRAARSDLGLTECGTSSSPGTFAIQNTGTADLVIGAVASGAAFSVSPSTLTLAAGATGSLTVTATVPSSAKAGAVRSGRLKITTNDPGAKRTDIALSVTPQGASFAFPAGATKEVRFGAVPPGEPAELLLSLQNVGNAPVTVGLAQPTDPVFSSDTTGNSAVGPGETFSAELFFTPTGPGFHRATSTLSVTGPVCGRSVSLVKMSGLGTQGLYGWPTSFDLDGPGIEFGPTACGASAPTSTFVLTNPDHDAARITGVTIAGAGYSTDLTAGEIITKGGQLSVTVSAPPVPFPSVPGTLYDGTLTITTNVPGDAPHVLALDESAAGAVLAFDTSATPGFGAFADTPIGTTASQTFGVVNTGTDSFVEVSTGGEFSTSLTGFELADGTSTPQSQTDTLFFTPTTLTASGTLSVNAPNGLCQPAPAPLALTGTGVGTGLGISPSSLFFSESCGQAAGEGLAVTNFGSIPVTWSVTSSAFNTSPSPYFAIEPSGSTLAPGEAVTAMVTSTGVPVPSTTPDTNTSFTFTSDDPTQAPLTVTISAEESGAQIGGIPGNVDFGSVTVGEQSTLFLPIFVGLPTDATLASSNSDFTFNSSAGLPNGFNGGQVGWDIMFRPTAVGPVTTTFTLGPGFSGTSICSPNTFTGTGQGIAP